MISNATIKAQVQALLRETNEGSREEAEEKFAQGMANIIEAALKSAEVSVTVQTAGTATAQSGTGTGSLN